MKATEIKLSLKKEKKKKMINTFVLLFGWKERN